MVQHMLEDRFALTFHRETREALPGVGLIETAANTGLASPLGCCPAIDQLSATMTNAAAQTHPKGTIRILPI